MMPDKKIYWITGLSGAGKTTLAKELVRYLRDQGETVVLLDGDELREVFLDNDKSISDGYEREARLKLAFRYSRLCQLLVQQGLIVVIATISLFKEIHAWNRENLPGYFEIYLKVPLEELRRRDPKGIYSRYDLGQLINVAGLDLSIDEPETPDRLIAFTSKERVKTIVSEILTS